MKKKEKKKKKVKKKEVEKIDDMFDGSCSFPLKKSPFL